MNRENIIAINEKLIRQLNEILDLNEEQDIKKDTTQIESLIHDLLRLCEDEKNNPEKFDSELMKKQHALMSSLVTNLRGKDQQMLDDINKEQELFRRAKALEEKILDYGIRHRLKAIENLSKPFKEALIDLTSELKLDLTHHREKFSAMRTDKQAIEHYMHLLERIDFIAKHTKTFLESMQDTSNLDTKKSFTVVIREIFNDVNGVHDEATLLISIRGHLLKQTSTP